MANTCYKECWWLTRAISGYFGSGEFKNGKGFRLESLAKFYTEEFKSYYDMTDPKEKKQFSVSIWRLRMRLYFQFGLIVFSDSTDAAIKGKGNGGYFYYLANPEILDEAGRTLREHIEFLAEFENNIPDTVDWEELKKRYTPATSSLGFITTQGGSSTYGYQITPGTTPRKILGEASLQDVQFAMLVGEVLTIKYGKVRSGIDINAPYSFEPYQVKEIEGRWYVIGNLYPLGHKELAELAIYDLARLEFADEENPDVRYEPVKGFGINNDNDDEKILKDIFERTQKPFEGGFLESIGEVHTIEIVSHTKEFAEYISKYPLCSSQERIADGKFRIYIKVTLDLIFMFGAYGAEFSFNVIPKNYPNDEFLGKIKAEILQLQLDYFRKTGE